MGDFLQDTNNRRLSAFPGATGRNINRDRLISTQSFNKSPPPPPLSVFLRTCWIISRSEESRSQYCVTLYVRLHEQVLLHRVPSDSPCKEPAHRKTTYNEINMEPSQAHSEFAGHQPTPNDPTDQGHRLCERTERCYTHKNQSMGNTTIL